MDRDTFFMLLRCLMLALVGAVATGAAYPALHALDWLDPKSTAILSAVLGGVVLALVEGRWGRREIATAMVAGLGTAVLLGGMSYYSVGHWYVRGESLFIPVSAGWTLMLWPQRRVEGVPT
jgi:hypothetical protein